MFASLALHLFLAIGIHTTPLDEAVVLKSSHVDDRTHDRIVVMSGKRAEYVLSCNEHENVLCVLPDVDASYGLERYTPGVYTCDNVRLVRNSPETAGFYCLTDVVTGHP